MDRISFLKKKVLEALGSDSAMLSETGPFADHLEELNARLVKNKERFEIKGLTISNKNIFNLAFHNFDFRDCMLDNVTLWKNQFRNCRFQGLLANKLIVYRCKAKDTEMAYATMHDTRFYGVETNACAFTSTRLQKFEASGCRFKTTRFTRVDIEDASYMNGCLFSKAALDRVHVSNAHMLNCDFIGCNADKVAPSIRLGADKAYDLVFTNSCLQNCRFVKSKFDGINIESRGRSTTVLLKDHMTKDMTTAPGISAIMGRHGIDAFDNFFYKCRIGTLSFKSQLMQKNRLLDCRIGELTHASTASLQATYKDCVIGKWELTGSRLEKTYFDLRSCANVLDIEAKEADIIFGRGCINARRIRMASGGIFYFKGEITVPQLELSPINPGRYPLFGPHQRSLNTGKKFDIPEQATAPHTGTDTAQSKPTNALTNSEGKSLSVPEAFASEVLLNGIDF